MKKILSIALVLTFALSVLAGCAAPAAAPAPAPAHQVYVVKKGDSVYKIAKRFGTTMQAIILANNLRNPNLIYPGQILLIPTVSTGEFYG